MSKRIYQAPICLQCSEYLLTSARIECVRPNHRDRNIARCRQFHSLRASLCGNIRSRPCSCSTLFPRRCNQPPLDQRTPGWRLECPGMCHIARWSNHTRNRTQSWWWCRTQQLQLRCAQQAARYASAMQPPAYQDKPRMRTVGAESLQRVLGRAATLWGYCAHCAHAGLAGGICTGTGTGTGAGTGRWCRYVCGSCSCAVVPAGVVGTRPGGTVGVF